MKRNSITFKLLSLIIGAFIISTVSVLFVANIQLTRIIDESQHELVEEKVEVILGSLYRSNERLKKTGLVEAYAEDFKEASLKSLRQTYYTNIDQGRYPIIIDTDGKVVMHPALPRGDLSLKQSEIVEKMLSSSEGDFDYTYLGQKKWCHFKLFPEWNWIVGSVVPLEIKYKDAREFRGLLFLIMGGITLLVMLVLSLIVSRFTKPLTRLTDAATSMAEGNLNQQIDIRGADEVGTLARSFSRMRDSIRQTILELEEENLERRKAEENLVQQNEYINSILESVSHPLYAVDVNNYLIKMANSASGIKVDGTTTCHASTHKRDTPCNGGDHPCPLEIIKETHKSTMVEHIHYDANGNQKNVEVYAYPVFDQHGELVQMIEYCIDVTERKQALKNLADEKERLSVTLRSIGDGVITTDISGNVVMLNKVAENLTGWSNDEAMGRPFKEIFHITDEQAREIYESVAEKVVSSKQIVNLANPKVLVAKDGTKRSITDSGAPILDTESEIIGVVVVFRDVTDQIKTEKELLKVKKLESIGVLAGGIAHDFNNILFAVLGNINLVRHIISPTEEKAQSFLEEAENASLRAQKLTQQLLTFSKGGEPVINSASIADIIEDSTTFVLRGSDIKFKADFPHDLWPVEVDSGQISQVVQNIVLNARQAMPRGGVLEISCSNVPPGDRKPATLLKSQKYVLVRISDSGIGIPANVLENIFDPYFTTKTEGSGLGLSICDSIINKHKGHISVQSTQGIGTKFSFYLPASSDAVIEEEADHSEMIYKDHDITILVMDDDPQVMETSTAIFTYLGCRTLQAFDGETAVELYKSSLDQSKRIDIVVMDLTIPGGMGGKEAVGEIIKIDPEAKVVVSSGYSNDPVMSNYKEYGFSAALVKPFRLEEVSRIFGEIIEKS